MHITNPLDEPGPVQVRTKLQGKCVAKPPEKVRVYPTTNKPQQGEEAGVSNVVILGLIVVLIVLLLAILFAVFCCIKRKQAPKKSQEYTTKGRSFT